MLATLKRWLLGPETDDGWGQSFADDLRYRRRFRRCRKQAVTWVRPDAAEAARWDAHPIVGRFGDMLAVAAVDGRTWVLRERLWHGWPDPPAFAWFAMAGEEVWAAADFDAWPAAWTRPPGYNG